MAYDQHPVRRCSPCDTDWPNINLYNLCPVCTRNTYASTANERPDYQAAKLLADKYKGFRDFCAQQDAERDMAEQQLIAELDGIFNAPAADLPGHGASKVKLAPLPSPQSVSYKTPPTNYGLAGDA